MQRNLKVQDIAYFFCETVSLYHEVQKVELIRTAESRLVASKISRGGEIVFAFVVQLSGQFLIKLLEIIFRSYCSL